MTRECMPKRRLLIEWSFVCRMQVRSTFWIISMTSECMPTRRLLIWWSSIRWIQVQSDLFRRDLSRRIYGLSGTLSFACLALCFLGIHHILHRVTISVALLNLSVQSHVPIMNDSGWSLFPKRPPLSGQNRPDSKDRILYEAFCCSSYNKFPLRKSTSLLSTYGSGFVLWFVPNSRCLVLWLWLT
jgi:hypothetical protein